jgi:hypothetical protein
VVRDYNSTNILGLMMNGERNVIHSGLADAIRSRRERMEECPERPKRRRGDEELGCRCVLCVDLSGSDQEWVCCLVEV